MIMQTAIPTPYDITAIPFVAWAPGLSTWGIFVLAFLIIATFVLFINWLKRGRSTYAIVAKLLQELTRVSTISSIPQIERVSRLARRILSHLLEVDLSSLSTDELRQRAAVIEDMLARDALTMIAQLKELSYAPQSSQTLGEASTLARTLIKTLNNYAARVLKP